ncbi:hypothetical protein C0J52_21815 [Blattella germanica]|nr:hypothetical protein C0J52_21815 [Blattella germanica]
MSLYLRFIILALAAALVSPQRINLQNFLQANKVTNQQFYNPPRGKNQCARNCARGELPKICYYQWTAEDYVTMGPACGSCLNTTSDCNLPQCVVANGFEKSIRTINRMVPGPTIDVCLGDRVIIDVTNMMAGAQLAIHWHGVWQQGTQYMDGVPMVTQCSIHEAETFRYDFLASNPGTHYWHSHDGLLIFQPGTSRITPPYHEVLVDQGRRYRLRLIAGMCTVCGVEVRIEGHDMTLIATDGASVNPVRVESVQMFSGERYDVVINANQNQGAYWIHVRGLAECNPNTAEEIYQVGVLRYSGFTRSRTDVPGYWPSFRRQGNVLNPQNATCASGQGGVCVSQLVGSEADRDNVLGRRPNVTLTLPFGFHIFPTRRDLFVNDRYRRYYVAPDKTMLTSWMGNNISFVSPSAPLLSQGQELDTSVFCPTGSDGFPRCPATTTEDYCECVYVIRIPLGSTVQMVIGDAAPVFDLHHPFHLHGYNFYVMAIDQFRNGENLQSISRGLYDQNFRRSSNPAKKDTVAIPSNGYAAIRFKADNPGLWFFHCHFMYHLATGMAVVIQVGNNRDWPAIPDDFPRCGNYRPSKFVEEYFQDADTKKAGVVCLGDRIIVDVKNLMPARSTTIHWHGLFQRGTQYMDGVPMVTQCPIMEGQTFRYDFRANNSGTHFWHSHDGLQKMDGLIGSLIVREPSSSDPNDFLYDLDHPSHVMLLTDWFHLGADQHFPGLSTHNKGQNAVTYLINGRGRYLKTRPPSSLDNLLSFPSLLEPMNIFQYRQLREKRQIIMLGETPIPVPYAVFRVSQGKKYRFRIIGGTCTVCPVEVNIELHSLLVIAVDGVPVEPSWVDSIVLYPGDRYDVVVDAKEPAVSYWIHIKGVGICANDKTYQLGILRYTGDPNKEPITNAPEYEGLYPSSLVMNGDGGSCRNSTRAVCLTQLRSSTPVDHKLFKPKADVNLELAFGFHRFTIEELFKSGTYHRYLQPPGPNAITSCVNNISMVSPPSPILSQPHDIPSNLFCPKGDKPTPVCGKEFCECFHLIKIPLGAVVQILLVDAGRVPGPMNHPFHLHGYTFHVLTLDVFGGNNTLENVRASLNDGKLPQGISTKPITKDTLAIPSNGYAVIRFKADNPGFWLFHCHFLYHLTTGMAAVLQVGNHEDVPPVPRNFNRCGDYLPSPKP